MNRTGKSNFVETLEYRRFAEFCDSCRRHQYIGLCYGSPGVGKTLSALRYSHWIDLETFDPRSVGEDALQTLSSLRTIFYTTPVVNTPGKIGADIDRLRSDLKSAVMEPLRREEIKILQEIDIRDRRHREEMFTTHDWLSEPIPVLKPTYAEVRQEYIAKQKCIGDPTELILVDEADRLRTASLEQMRVIFDEGRIGLVLIGMPGIEKRLARYPQFYSRIGFVHEFRTLSANQVRELLAQHWRPTGVALLDTVELDNEAVAAIIRVTSGNFRLLERLLTQAERILVYVDGSRQFANSHSLVVWIFQYLTRFRCSWIGPPISTNT
jgi:DNA transposition AAA+ family ATPase